MKFDDLDKRLRQFETERDFSIPSDKRIVARLDGRGFTKLTKDVLDFKRPFDERFRDMMIETTLHVMNCGFHMDYGYTQSDEISLLFRRDETSFGRKSRKLLSLLAGEASARFSLACGKPIAFDCRLSLLHKESDIIDYFRWRQEDAHRNSLNAHCYWRLRNAGESPKQADGFLMGKSKNEKLELLRSFNVEFEELPAWQKWGIGIYWENYEKTGWNPKKKSPVSTQRRQLKINQNLPNMDAYGEFLGTII